MTNIADTRINIADKNVRIAVPFSKVDAEKRMVHGFATLDNIDSQDDIVTYESSIGAFERFRGNIREMHDKKAVGKMISFRPESIVDPKTGKEYKGIFVSTYVSKGAQDTWEKVLDGTLTGFSIGGHINKSDSRYDETIEKVVRTISDYDVTELSLVDNPANPLANFLAFEKSADGSAGYIAEVETENVFYCPEDNVVQMSGESSSECNKCSKSMRNLGFVEVGDPERSTIVKSLLANARSALEVGDMVEFDAGIGKVEAIISKGNVAIPGTVGSFIADESDPSVIINIFDKSNGTIVSETNYRIIKNMSNIRKYKEEEVPETNVELAPAERIVAEASAPADAPADVPADDHNDDKDDAIVAVLAELSANMGAIVKALNELPGFIASIEDRVRSAEEAANDASETAKAAVADLRKSQEEAEGLKKSVDKVVKDTALRKSAEVGDVQASIEKQEGSFWGGTFLNSPAGF